MGGVSTEISIRSAITLPLRSGDRFEFERKLAWPIPAKRLGRPDDQLRRGIADEADLVVELDGKIVLAAPFEQPD